MTETDRRFRGAEDLLNIDGVSRESLPALETYVDLLLHWQRRINLIGPGTVEDVWHRHVADSLQLLPLLQQQPGSILDLGSGAGFPGIPLAIVHARHNGAMVHLVESNSKKASFLREAVRLTSARAEVHCGRIESLDSDALQVGIGVVTSRALASLPDLLNFAQKPLENRAVALFHKGRGVDDELTEAHKYWKLRLERIPSLTEPGACILKIEEATRVA